ncbi:MAG: transposase, partial [Verrucomicrobiota bacterium]|nr:transposase [Verrucomicrobiota bacterium]
MTAEPRREDHEKRAARLRRLDRIYLRSPTYFVTACTANRRAFLAKAEVHGAFVQFAERGMERGVWIGRYVIMPDHIHLFVVLDDQKLSLTNWIKSLKNAISKTLRSLGVESPHWQKGFFDHVLRSGESYWEKWEYVRINPERAGLVTRADDWFYQGEIYPLDVR